MTRRLNKPEMGVADFLSKSLEQKAKDARRQEVVRKRLEDDVQLAQASIQGGWSLDDSLALERTLNEMYRRDSAALKLYQPMQTAWDFHNSMAGENGLIGSNRSGKSTAASVEVAWAATGTHPIKDKYPRNGIEICCVGPRLEHLSLMYNMLFGQGKTFRVLKNGIYWKIPKWTDPEDMARFDEWQYAPPLIEHNMIDGKISWYSAAAEQPAIIRLKNGTNFYFFSYEQDPPRGVPFHLSWMEEENPRVDRWLSELRARHVSVMGRLIWSSTPESATPTFWDLKVRSERPDMAQKEPYSQTRFFEMKAKDNQYLPPLGLEAASERLSEDDPEAASAKIDGEPTFRKFLVYPEFDENRHLIEPFEIEWRDTVYACIDPGRVRCGILFVVLVHPDSPHYLSDQPDRIIAFDEVLLITSKRTGADGKEHYVGVNSQTMARAFERKFSPYKHWIEDITIDYTQGRKKDENDIEIAEHYWNELQNVGINPRAQRFVQGASNVNNGIEAVSKRLAPMEDKPPSFVIMRGKCPKLTHEFKKYQREQLKGQTGRLTPGSPIAKRTELVDCTRYLCSRDLTWVQPPALGHGSNAFTAAEIKRFDNPREWAKFLNQDFLKQFERKKRS